MYRLMWLMCLSFILVFAGCESREPAKPETEQHQVGNTQEKLSAKEEEKSPAAAAEAVVKKAEENVEKVKQEAEAIVDETKENVEEKIEATVDQVQTSVKDVTTPMTKETKSAAPDAASGPEEIVLTASYGNVTFSHGQHAKDLDCTTCHEGEPQAFDLTKGVAHKLCKGCHKDGGAGPTSCKDCHKK